LTVYPEQLQGQLESRLAPIYLIHGDEPLLAMEAADAVRAAARRRGHDERLVYTIEPAFDWNTLAAGAASGSLFASHRLLELRMEDARPGDAGSKALSAYAGSPPPDTVLLVLCGKLDAAARKSRWFGALDRAGISVPVRPIEPERLPAWVEARLRARGLRASPEAIQLLAARGEGNLLAADQEIAKLALLHAGGVLEAEQVRSAVGDSARFSVFELVDSALAGKAPRVLRIAAGLRTEGVEPVLVCWALAREVQLLHRLHGELAGDDTRGGAAARQVFSRHKVWPQRQPLIRQALARLSRADCARLLGDCARLDRIVKGVETGDAWDTILQLSLALAGRRLMPDLQFPSSQS
jgi:DNA polymerase-3 subunit delta